MDKGTRNAIERATQRARRLLEEEFAAQLDGTFDVNRNGTVASKGGAHLSARQALLREKIVAAVEHKQATGMGSAEAVTDYLRDAAFTTLNRFAALKMLEARDLVQECVTKGEQSTGFREFCGMAPGVALLPESAGYRLYIECLFDELSTEVKVLFDRRDTASVLWPRRTTFEALLEILNASEIAGVWGEDETIGWVYQFFNGGDERRAMREASQAPRNSRELAVRNQFFTPRYVVQFLTDNTLGRIWYEMRRGETSLRERCEYLVRRPQEVLLRDAGRSDPGEEWVERVVAGDLLAVPEDFAWATSARFAHLIDGYALSTRLGLGELGDFANACSARAAETGTWEGSAVELWLCLFYEHRRARHSGYNPEAEALARLDSLCRALRAALVVESEQPQGLRLVAHRPKKDPRELRVLDPACGSGHFLLYAFDLLIAIYEEAHGDPESPKSAVTGKSLAAEYPTLDALRRALPALVLTHNLHGVDIDPRCAQIAQLALWMRAQRALRDYGIQRGERACIRRSNIVVAEPLVADEKTLADFLAKLGDVDLGRVFSELVETLKLAGDLGLLLRVERLVARGPKHGQTGDLFAPPEVRIRAAITEFAETPSALGRTRRRLFADDAAQGVGLLETAEKKFDVVLMNPPFGSPSEETQHYIDREYPSGRNDMYSTFVVRAIGLLASHGVLGALTSRSFLTGRDHRKFRRDLLADSEGLTTVLDLGAGVLDGAVVETCAFVVTRSLNDQIVYLSVRSVATPTVGTVRQAINATPRFYSRREFRRVPMCQLVFDASEIGLARLMSSETFEPHFARVTFGLTTKDDWRFVRARWEAEHRDGCAGWELFAKGGEYSWFSSDARLVIDREGGGRELAANAEFRGAEIWATCRSSVEYGKAAATFSERSQKGFSVRRLRRGMSFSSKSGVIIPLDNPDNWVVAVAGVLASSDYMELVNAQSTFGSFEISAVKILPTPPAAALTQMEAWLGACREVDSIDLYDELSLLFLRPPPPDWSAVDAMNSALASIAGGLRALDLTLDTEVQRLQCAVGRQRAKELEGSDRWWSYAVGVAFGRWDTSWLSDDSVRPLLPEPLAALGFRARSIPPRASHSDGRRDILVGDAGHPDDIVSVIMAVREEFASLTALPLEFTKATEEDLRRYARVRLFEVHLATYTAGRRRAPIYWQLATPSATYSVWLYLHEFTRDTFYKVQNDYVVPKLAHEERRLEALRREIGDGARSAERKTLTALEILVDELRAFLDEVKRVTPLWNPDLDDGVVINFAPLWRLVPHHRPWQKELKATWDALCAGEYDWAHLAMYLWPERVVPKCTTDRSLAIAHGLEDEFWVKDFEEKWQPRRPRDATVGHVMSVLRDAGLARTFHAIRAFWNAHHAGSADVVTDWWQRLEGGDNDIEPIAYELWPQRIREKAATDRAVAEAHGLLSYYEALQAAPRVEAGALNTRRKRDATPPTLHTGAVPEMLRSFFSLPGDTAVWKARWAAFDAGEFDGTMELALRVRTEHVVNRGAEEVAVAERHGFDRWFWIRGPGGGRRLGEPEDELKRAVEGRSSPAVKAALKSLTEAPTASGGTAKRTRKGKTDA